MRYLSITAASLGLLLSAGCATSPPEEQARQVRAVGNQDVQRVEILAGSYWFRPEHIVVKAGTPVVLSVRKESGIIPHSFVINEPQAGLVANVDLETEPQEIRLTPIVAGRYPFFCDKTGIFGRHREKGMEGVLEVVE